MGRPTKGRRGKALYDIIFVCADATTYTRTVRGAPRTSNLVLNKPEGARWVMRYFPSFDQWRLYRVDKFIMNPSVGQFYKAPKPVIAPGREAAIMYALLCLN